uniref:Clp ATPase C-terminal domain-containing protein n=1 Tax=Oryza glumipatula TaxID=40148 RepID=A0A0E0BHN2_9ORYZ
MPWAVGDRRTSGRQDGSHRRPAPLFDGGALTRACSVWTAARAAREAAPYYGSSEKRRYGMILMYGTPTTGMILMLDPSPATAGRPDPSLATAGRPDQLPATMGTTAVTVHLVPDRWKICTQKLILTTGGRQAVTAADGGSSLSRVDSTRYGARPLRRAVVRLLEDTFAERMFAREVGEGDLVIVDADSAGKCRGQEEQHHAGTLQLPTNLVSAHINTGKDVK